MDRNWMLEKGNLCRADGQSLTAEDALRAGMALGKMKSGGAVGAGRADSPAARALLMAAESGVLQSGGALWSFGGCFESQFSYCCGRSGADFGIFTDFSGEIHIVSMGGLPLSREEEHRFLELMEENCWKPGYTAAWGNRIAMESLQELYRIELIKAAETSLLGMTASVKCPNPVIRKLVENAMLQLGCRLREGGVTLQISGDGKDISVYERVQDYLFTDRVLCLVCLDLFRRGQDIAVPESAPRVLEEAAAALGRKVFRYEDGFPSSTNRKARALGARQLFLRDGPMLGLRLLSILRRSGGSLSRLEQQIPLYGRISRMVPAGNFPLLETMVFSFPMGELRMKPVKNGQFAFLWAEGRDMEAAEELCRLGEEKLSHGPDRS